MDFSIEICSSWYPVDLDLPVDKSPDTNHNPDVSNHGWYGDHPCTMLLWEMVHLDKTQRSTHIDWLRKTQWPPGLEICPGIWGRRTAAWWWARWENNLYQPEISYAQNFYRINSGWARSSQMAFVFRNTDGLIIWQDPSGSRHLLWPLEDTSRHLQKHDGKAFRVVLHIVKAGDVTDCSVLASSVADINIFVMTRWSVFPIQTNSKMYRTPYLLHRNLNFAQK